MQQSQHEIADALLWLNYSPQAQPALPKIDEGKKTGGGVVGYSSAIPWKELLTPCQQPTSPACLIFYEQINKVSSLCVFIDLCELFACRYLSGGGKTRLGAVQVPHASIASGFSEDSRRRKEARSYYSIIIIQLFENHFISDLTSAASSNFLSPYRSHAGAQQRLIETRWLSECTTWPHLLSLSVLEPPSYIYVHVLTCVLSLLPG